MVKITKNQLAMKQLKNANAANRRANKTAQVKAKMGKSISKNIGDAITGSVTAYAASKTASNIADSKRNSKAADTQKIIDAYNAAIMAKDSSDNKENTGDKSVTEVGGGGNSGSKLGG